MADALTLAGGVLNPSRPRAVEAGSVRLVRERGDMAALLPQWQDLEAADGQAGLFQSPGWASAIFDFEAGRGNTNFDPVIATAWQGTDLVALLPLERVSTGMRRVLVPLGHAFAQYSDLLIRPGTDGPLVLEQMVAALSAAVPADTLSFFKVRDGSSLSVALPPERVVTGEEQGAPFVDLSGFADFAAYFHTIKAKTRKNMRNARNRLERDGAVHHLVAETAADQGAIIGRTLAGRAGRLKQQGLTSRAFRDGGFADFCASLPGREGLSLLAFSLTHGDQPIAEQWGFVHGGQYYAYVASRDFAIAEESPGKLHLGEVIAAVQERGVQGCDLGVPAMPYKLTWATLTVPVRDHVLPLTLRGRLLVGLWDVRLRPLLKSVAMRLPPGLRTRLMGLVHHGH
ncbi:MAG: GNAT family N-acetyltransferase [Devosia sp.]|uniref:GNAT family N-acetyltransferase n=1 Tax=Devosia sp. TaxID=1871048 RepID=UPI0024CABC40|nr:GNAT family N-acetyltransferase [Devosia sp.]UYN98684.1 MAG: GNAT family N-acetyltransferase [Devosia sp.]